MTPVDALDLHRADSLEHIAGPYPQARRLTTIVDAAYDYRAASGGHLHAEKRVHHTVDGEPRAGALERFLVGKRLATVDVVAVEGLRRFFTHVLREIGKEILGREALILQEVILIQPHDHFIQTVLVVSRVADHHVE